MHTTEQLSAALAGRYVVDRLIGEGGMATVYLARDVRHNRKVALKVLRPDLGAVVGVERFLSEIQVTANLQHPNLLPLFDSGEAGGLLFYVMPYVEGESLRARLEREKQLPIDETIRIATAIAGALDYAHRQGVIHRDLKPENILMHEGQPLVADFGIALAVSNAGGNRITQTGLSLGTPQYMSPEQATGDRTIDARTDVYSLGAIVYEMLAGEAPHTGSSSQAIIARVLTEKPRSIRSSRPSVPPHVEAAVERALDKLPADRLATAKEFADAITGARPLTTSASTAPAILTAPPAVTRTWRRRTIEIAVVSVAVLGAASTAYLATRHAPMPIAGRFVVEMPDSVVATGNSAQSVAISADGSLLAILGEKRGVRLIYLRRLEDPVAQPVRGTEGALYHSFSADGRWLVFVVGRTLKMVAVEGGTPQTLADSVNTNPASWGPNREVLYAAGSGVWAVSSDGGHRRLVAKPDSARDIYAVSYPAFLPDGAHALVTIQGKGGTFARRLGVLSLGDGKITEFDLPGRISHYVSSGHIVFARDGGLIFAAPFSLRRNTVTGPPVLLVEQVREATAGAAVGLGVAQNGTLIYQSGDNGTQTELLVVGRNGVARPLKGVPQAFWQPRASPDGKKISVQVGPTTNAGGLWIYDIAAGTLNRLTLDSGSVRGEWTRDGGSHITYVDRAGTDSERIVTRLSDGSGAPQTIALSAAPANNWSVALGKPHGWSIVRHGFSPNGDIYIAPTDSLGASRPFIATPANELDPHMSPGGTMLAYTSNESGRYQVYVTAIPGPGPHVPVSVDGGTEPAWSTDGTVFFRGPTHMMTAAIIERPTLSVTKRDTVFADPYLRVTAHANYDVMPGGREFIMLRPVTSIQSSIYVIVNWQQLSRTRGATEKR